MDDYPFEPNATDYALVDRQSASWASFINFGTPSNDKYGTLKGWEPAFQNGDVDVYVIGGPHEGLSAESGANADELAGGRLRRYKERERSEVRMPIKNRNMRAYKRIRR